MSTRSNNIGFAIMGVCIAAGLALAGYFIGNTLYNSNVALNTAQVKGLAERRVKANMADWSVMLTIESDAKNNITDLFARIKQQQQTVVDLLQQNGFSENEIKAGVVQYRQEEFRNDQRVLVEKRHVLNALVSVETDKVEKVAGVRASVNELLGQGYDLNNYSPIYRFTELNQIKPDMLEEATRNARIAAEQFAEDAGVSVGGIRSARQGNFSISDANGHGNSRTIEKDVRVVTHIEFYLTD